MTACLSGDYGKGVSILSQLFVETNDATYIFNQGRCFEQNARYAEAIARFQEYLTVGRKLTAGDRAAAQKHIATCEAMLAKQPRPDVPIPPNEKKTTTSTVDMSRGEPAATTQSRPNTTAQPVVSSTRQPVHATGEAWRTTGIVVAGVGGAALVSGVILNLKVNGMADDFRKLNGYSDAKESDRKTYETWGWVSYGVGAACVATGALLYLLGHRGDRQDGGPLVIAPAVSGAGVAATLNGRF